MKILITGASGYLGLHVLTQLRALNLDPVVLGRNAIAGHEDLRFINVDLLSHPNLAPMLADVGATHLLHLAWYAEYGKFWTSPQNFEWVQATLRLVNAFAQTGGERVVAAGSCAEYTWDDGYLQEFRTAHEPKTLYGVAKDATRRLITSQCAALGLSCAWGHIFFPFGPGEARGRMIPSLIEVFRGRAVPFGVNAAAYRGMLYVPDAARAFVALLQAQDNGPFNICSGNPMSIAEVVHILGRECGADPMRVLELATSRAGDPHILVGDNTRLRAIGWQPHWTVEAGLVDTLRQVA